MCVCVYVINAAHSRTTNRLKHGLLLTRTILQRLSESKSVKCNIFCMSLFL